MLSVNCRSSSSSYLSPPHLNFTRQLSCQTVFFFCCLYSCSNFIASIYSSNFFSAVFIILCFCSTPENGQSGSILNMSPRLSSYFNTVSTFDIFACLILAHQMLVKYYSHLFLEFFISLTLLNKFTLLVGVLRGSCVFPSFSSGSVCGNVQILEFQTRLMINF